MPEKNEEEKTATAVSKDKDDVKKDEEASSAGNASLTLEDVIRNVILLDKLVASKDLNKMTKVWRNNTKIRRKITPGMLKEALEHCLSADASAPVRESVLKYLSSVPNPSGPETDVEMDTDSTGKAATPPAVKDDGAPEIHAYLWILVGVLLVEASATEMANECFSALIQYCAQFNRRTLDHLLARAYFYFAHTADLLGKSSDIQSMILKGYRTAALRHDEIGQATLLNIMLKVYLQHNLYDQASLLVSKSNFPEAVSNAQFCRFLYYTGRVSAVQLDYSDAFNKLTQCLRKAPQNTGVCFRTAAQKLAIIVQLLMGEIPERSTFDQVDLVDALRPYLELTNAVRVGDLTAFQRVVDVHVSLFQDDKTYTLILRLRHNVIKTGLRKINISYSAISLQDVYKKLGLENVEEAESVCAKAIFDGVIDATIDFDKQALMSNDVMDIYCTAEPYQTFHKRITFCLDVHNEAVKAMRYPPDAYKNNLDGADNGSKDIEQELTAEDLVDDDDQEM